MSNTHHRRRLCALAAAALAGPPAALHAQPPPATVIITGNPLGRDSTAQASSVLSGDNLVLKRAGTLGETLDGLPGVTSTWFGPNSARPVIRGLDGDRVRVLDNGAAAIDASNLSFDHAVAVDPLVFERIEVLRGPAALMYGGSAIGGVVNAIDNRIPRAPLGAAGGRVELRLGGAAAERAGAAVLEGGAGNLAWHADAYSRSAGDLRVPLYTPVAEGEGLEPSRRVRNSASKGEGGAVGAAWTDDNGHAGLSIDSFRSRYGVTVEPDVTINMQRQRLAFSLQRRKLVGPLSQLDVQASTSNYVHQEIEGSGAIGTTFRSRGSELRMQAHHTPLGSLTGVIGLQSDSLSFSALGEEAFVPSTRTRSNALFVIEELHTGPLTWTAGLRTERTKVSSAGDAGADDPRFGDASERQFTPKSLSLASTWAIGRGWAISASAGHTERAPAYYELFANGLHVATAAYERGDTTLGTERSRHADVGLEWKQDGSALKVNLFRTAFSRFISLDASGRHIELPGAAGAESSSVPEYVFRAVRARLQGIEVEGRLALTERPWVMALTSGLDIVRGQNLDSNEALPRLAPLRLRVGIEASQGAWRLGFTARHAATQTRVPTTDSATPASNLLSAWTSWQSTLGGADALWFLRLDNLGKQLAYNASTIGTIRLLAPLPGRSASAGVRLRF